MPENKETPSFLRRAQIFMVDLSLTIVGLLTIAGGAYYVYKDNPAMAATCMGTGLVLLFAATIDRFESLKGLGMEAKTRKLDATINRAELALTQLKELTEIASKAIISLSSKAGRLSSAPSVEEAYEQVGKVRKILQSVGSNEAAISNTLRPWAQMSASDIAYKQIQPLQTALESATHDLSREIINNEHSQTINAESRNAVINRRDSINLFLKERIHNIYQWDLDDLSTKLIALVNDAPEIPAELKAELHKNFVCTCDQIKYLASEMDFKDPEFWMINSRLNS